jgi:hypothetical protein
MREALACELLAACMSALRSYGLSTSSLLKLSRQAAVRQRSANKTAKVILEATQQLAELTARWGEDPKYLDSAGRPAVLEIKGGRGDFASLAGTFFPHSRSEDVLRFGCETKVIERVGRDRVARLNDYVVFSGNSLLILAYSVRAIRRYLSTANFNRQAHVAMALDRGRADRTSACEVFDEDVKEFMRVMRPQISDLVEMSNRWLARRASKSGAHRKRDSKRKSRKRKVAGIQAFLFAE